MHPRSIGAQALRIIGCLLLVIIGLSSIEAQQPQPFHAKSRAAWIAVVLPDNWASDRVSRQLINSLQNAPPGSPLSAWIRTARVDKRLASDPICKEPTVGYCDQRICLRYSFSVMMVAFSIKRRARTFRLIHSSSVVRWTTMRASIQCSRRTACSLILATITARSIG